MRRRSGRDGAHKPRVHIVTLSIGHVTRELMICSDTTVEEIRACITSVCSPEIPHDVPVAVRHTSQKVVYPLSFIVHAPQRFINGIFEVIWGEMEGETNVRPPSERLTSSIPKRNVSSPEEQSIGMPEFIDTYDLIQSPPVIETDEEEEEDDEEDEEEAWRELDLTDFELPPLVQVFTRACPDGILTRSTLTACLQQLHVEEPSHRMFHRVFDIFTTRSCNQVDLYLFLGGLSVLVQGEGNEKILCIFTIYDQDHDGFITLDEMKRYLTAVFMVIYKTSPELFQQRAVDPMELGAITAQACFDQANLPSNGLLSYAAFQRWYSIPSSWPTKDSCQIDYTPSELLEKLAALVNPQGLLSFQAFQTLFPSSMHRLFIAFDQDQDGWIDFCELASGLSICCQGSFQQKIQAVFTLFDLNHQGVLTPSEMETYVASVYRMMYTTSISQPIIDQLAHSTVEKAFQHKNQLSLKEFTIWYTCPNLDRLSEIKSQLRLETYDALDMMEYFKSSADANGNLSKSGFFHCFYKLNQRMEASTRDLLVEVFTALDTDHNGWIDVLELSAGLSILCSGNKLASLFHLYDTNQDGLISFHEMEQYLTAVFTILYTLGPTLFTPSPIEMASITTTTCFQRFSDTIHHSMTMDEFTTWIQEESDSILALVLYEETWEGLGSITLTQLKQFARLSMYEPTQVFEVLAAQANEQGMLSKSIFLSCLESLCGTNDKQTVRVWNALFDLFTTEGMVDFSEIASGLSILCGGTSEEKVQAAFSLYDFNHDGFISFQEMETYLVSVFRVLFQLKRETNVSVSAEELGHIMTLQAFEEADQNQDGQLTYEEFQAWYRQSNPLKEEEWTCFQTFSPSHVFETLAQYTSTQGTLDRESFHQALTELTPQHAPWLVDRLFDIFNRNGNVDFSEVASGVSILCGGQDLEKIRAVFQLYDVNHDGFLSLEEMELYLTSVFNVMYQVSPDLYQRMGVSYQELGKATAQHAFESADTDRDGRISFDEFLVWYQKKEKTNTFKRYTPHHVFTIFANQCSDDGTLSRSAFETAWKQLIENASSEQIDRFFALFDMDGNGLVDFCELTSGLSVLCGGTREDKIKAAFALYDVNQDGFISLDEMIRYLTSVYKVLYETNPSLRDQLQVEPSELATVTAEQCFVDADVNHDGRLSFDEFVQWYTQSNLQPPTSPVVSMSSPNMEHTRQLLKLDTYEVHDIFEIFAEAAPSGELNFAQFKKCFDQLIQLAGGGHTAKEKEEAEQLIRRLFRVFDTNQSNTVDFGELASGLSVLSGSTMDDKVRAAFQLYDLNGDGSISMEEMISYMTSIFKVMYETSDNHEMKVSPEELAQITAMQCFKEADINHDGKLSFEEFKKWCTLTA